MSGAIVHCVPALHVGGVNRHLLAVVEEIASATDLRQVVCSITDAVALAPQFEAAGVAVETLGHEGWRTAGRTLQRLAGVLDRTGADILHSHLMLPQVYAAVASRRARIPHVLTLHDPRLDPYGVGQSGLPRRLAVGATLHLAERYGTDVVIAVSDDVAGAHRSRLVRRRTPIHVIPNGVHTGIEEVPPTALARLRRQIGIDVAAPVVLNVGRLVDVKNQALLIDAMPSIHTSHPDAVLLVVGRGPEESRLAALVDGSPSGDRVRLLGLRHDVPALMALAQVVVSASTLEGFGLTALEAAVVGRPLVSPPVPAAQALYGAWPDVCLVDEPTPSAFAERVVRLLDSSELRRRIGAGASSLAKDRYDIERSVGTLLHLYRHLIEGGRPPA